MHKRIQGRRSELELGRGGGLGAPFLIIQNNDSVATYFYTLHAMQDKIVTKCNIFTLTVNMILKVNMRDNYVNKQIIFLYL